MCIPGRIPAVLVRIPVDNKIEEIGADTAVIEQGIAFARSTISTHLCTIFLALNQEGQKLALGAMNLRTKPRVGSDILKTDLPLVSE